MKKCTICKQTKHSGDFYFIKSGNYYSPHCIQCEKLKAKERRNSNPDGWIGVICGTDEWMKHYFL